MTSDDTFTSEATVSFALAPGLLPAPLPTAPIFANALGYRF